MQRSLKTLSIISLLGLLLITGCTPELGKYWTQESYTPHMYQKIAVVGVTENIEARKAFEDRAVQLLKRKGIKAVAGLDIFPQDMSDEDREPKKLIKRIQENKLDGVLTMTLINTEENLTYVGGDSRMVPNRYDYAYGSFTVKSYETIKSGGEFVTSESFLIEAVLHDLSGELYEGKETLVWTGQSTLTDPESITLAADEFTEPMVANLIKNKILLKK